MSREGEVCHSRKKVFISWGGEGGGGVKPIVNFLIFKYLWHCLAPPEVQRLSTECPQVQAVQYQSAHTQ